MICPGERVDRAVVEYLTSGVEHGMYVPDSSDPELRTAGGGPMSEGPSQGKETEQRCVSHS
ncbi:hypothetical protein OG272_40260 [Streptomyces sp. NBC_00104]|uniref:hypothetical protein n=1 Tax=Streptomyces sp. NBC_00024 TaxID=2903612 RepID=UPI0032550673